MTFLEACARGVKMRTPLAYGEKCNTGAVAGRLAKFDTLSEVGYCAGGRRSVQLWRGLLVTCLARERDSGDLVSGNCREGQDERKDQNPQEIRWHAV